MPPAARLTDMHVCSKTTGAVPHVGGPITGPGGITVKIGGMVAAVVGDAATCVGPPDSISKGSATVKICGKQAARVGDMTSHQGVISPPGCVTVNIGG
jgi:uncharacterized Zn-binding protein involved in type VI secretion